MKQLVASQSWLMVSEGSSRTGLGLGLDLTPAHCSSGGSDGSSVAQVRLKWGRGRSVTSALCCSTLRAHNRVTAAPWVRQMKDTVDPHNCSHHTGTAVATVAMQWAGPSPGPGAAQTGWAAPCHYRGVRGHFLELGTWPPHSHITRYIYRDNESMSRHTTITGNAANMLCNVCASMERVWNVSVGLFRLSTYLYVVS